MEPGVHAAVIDALAGPGYAVVPGYAAPALSAALRDEALAMWAGGGFRHARVGIGAAKELRTEVRRDWVHWLDPDDLSTSQARYWAAIDALRVAVNEQLFLSLHGFEAHLALYPPEAYYRRHTDQFKGAGHRKITVILYLNEAWTDADGGRLRLYVPEGEGERPVDVEPRAGTLVAFRSDVFEHEVLPATTTRLSLTGWLRTRA